VGALGLGATKSNPRVLDNCPPLCSLLFAGGWNYSFYNIVKKISWCCLHVF